MAGDWIKVEECTPGKTEIREAARLCGISRSDAFLAWFRLYCWLGKQTADGYVQFLRHEDVDDESGVKGFGAAMAAVGWLTFDNGGASVANWDRHNSEAAKQRALTQERVRRHRTQQGM